jgi:hypothetical protein
MTSKRNANGAARVDVCIGMTNRSNATAKAMIAAKRNRMMWAFIDPALNCSNVSWNYFTRLRMLLRDESQMYRGQVMHHDHLRRIR